MNQNKAANQQKSPIFGGVLYPSPDGKKPEMRSRGWEFFTGSYARKIEGFFIESAIAAGEDLPPRFAIFTGEIFYENLRIEENRLFGHRDHASFADSSVETACWSTATMPHEPISFDEDGKPMLAIDKNSDYVSVIKYKDELILTWNVTRNTFDKLRDKAAPVTAQFFESATAYDEAAAAARLKQSKYFSRLQKNDSLNSESKLRNLTIRGKSTDNSDFYNVTKTDESGTANYTYSRRKIEEEHERRAADFVDSSKEAVEKIMDEHGLDEAEARDFLKDKKSAAAAKLAGRGTEPFNSNVEKILDDALPDIRREGTTLSAFDWRKEEGELDAKAHNEKRKLSDDVKKHLEKRIHLPEGRPKGATNSKTKEEEQKIYKTQYEEIEKAIRSIYLENLDGTNDHEAANPLVTMTAVAEFIGRSRPILNNWLRSAVKTAELSDFETDFADEQILPNKIFNFIKGKTIAEIRLSKP